MYVWPHLQRSGGNLTNTVKKWQAGQAWPMCSLFVIDVYDNNQQFSLFQLTLVHDFVLLDVDVLIGKVRWRVPARAVSWRHLAHEASNLVEVTLLLGTLGLGAVNNGRRVWTCLMFFQMPVKVGLLAEASITKRTLERFLLVVNVPDVPLEIGGDGKWPFAVFALVWLLSCVGAEVSGQVSRSWKDFATKFAGVPILWFPVVNAAVHQVGIASRQTRKWYTTQHLRVHQPRRSAKRVRPRA